MDNSDSLDSTTTILMASSNRKRKISAENSLAIPSKRAKFYETYISQLFTLPDSIMHYTAMNPTNPELYQKMIKLCKYFYIQNPIIIIPWLSCYQGQKYWEGTEIDLYMTNLTCKIWVTKHLKIYKGFSGHSNLFASIFPKILSFTAKSLSLMGQVFSYSDFLLIASNIEEIFFFKVSVKFDDGSIAPFEKIVEAAIKIKEITYTDDKNLSSITKDTVAKLFKLPHILNLTKCSMIEIPEAFDITMFYSYVKKNQNTDFGIRFDNTISAAYKVKVEKIVDEIIDTAQHNYIPPLLNYDGFNRDKVKKLDKICKAAVEAAKEALRKLNNDGAVRYWRSWGKIIYDYCGHLEIQYSRKNYEQFISKIQLSQISLDSKPDTFHTPIDNSGFRCISMLLTGKEDNAEIIRKKLNQKFAYYFSQDDNFDEEKLIEIIGRPFALKNEHLETLIRWFKCRIMLYCSGEGWKKFGECDDESIPLFVLEKNDSGYQIVLSVKK